MKFGIRGKLVGTLVLAGLLPLALALGSALVALHNARARFAGQSFRAMARQQAEHLSVQLQSQIEFLRLINQLPGTIEFLAKANSVPPHPEATRSIEAGWADLPPDHPLLRSILENELARRWQAIQRQQPRLAEIIITDASGRLVAASNKTSDYFQADEPWWIKAYAGGAGRLILDQVRFDASATSEGIQPGAEVVDVAIPITAGSKTGAIIGMMKASLHASWLIGQVEELATAGQDEMHLELSLIRNDGQPVLRLHGNGQNIPVVPETTMKEIRHSQDGYLVARHGTEEQVIGFTRLSFLGNAPAATDWYFIVTAPKRSALAPTRQLMWLLTAVGLPFIIITFILGLWMARREILRPILMLELGTTELEKGNFDYRLIPPGEPGSVFRNDELGNLANDFNRMAAELGRNVQELHRANRLKQQFIDLASHELRTPIAYILGVTELAQRQSQGNSPLLDKISSKAKRLNRIVENMFKLLQGGEHEPLLSLAPVDPSRIMAMAAQDLAPFLKERNQHLETRAQPVEGVWLADLDKLRDILNNLLSNAVRFSPDGGTIVLELSDRDTEVELSVTDQGPGVPDAELPHIFQPFYTGPSANLEHHTSGEAQFMSRGIGLGLSVVKRFAEMHGGSVTAQRGAPGMTFRVQLPKHPSS